MLFVRKITLFSFTERQQTKIKQMWCRKLWRHLLAIEWNKDDIFEKGYIYTKGYDSCVFIVYDIVTLTLYYDMIICFSVLTPTNMLCVMPYTIVCQFMCTQIYLYLLKKIMLRMRLSKCYQLHCFYLYMVYTYTYGSYPYLVSAVYYCYKWPHQKIMMCLSHCTHSAP